MMVAFLSEDSGAHRALPPQLHQHLVLRGAREKPIANDDALPLSRPGSTASNEACSDSLASGTSETDSTQPTTFSMLRAGPSVSTCLNENDPGSSRSQNLDDEGGVLKPSIPGLINRVRAPKSRRRYGTVIVDPRKDNSYRVPSSQSVNTSDSGSSNRRPTTAYQGSRWPGNSHPGHPIPYMGAFSRVSSYKTAQESSVGLPLILPLRSIYRAHLIDERCLSPHQAYLMLQPRPKSKQRNKKSPPGACRASTLQPHLAVDGVWTRSEGWKNGQTLFPVSASDFCILTKARYWLNWTAVPSPNPSRMNLDQRWRKD